MKVAVSIPDPIFAEAEVMAKRLKLSRSKVYARALDEFVTNHAIASVTEAMNAALAEAGQASHSFVHETARRAFARTEW
jgi:hypothetical protein